MRKAVLYLKDILAALDSIQAFIAGFDVAAFQGDDKTLSAVIRKFEIIGEAAKGLPEVIREQYPEVPWKHVGGIRDKVVHDYVSINDDIVWALAKEERPARLPSLTAIHPEGEPP